MRAAPLLFCCASILLAASALACHSWQVQNTSPAVVLRDRPASVEVHPVLGAKFVLVQPILVGDTITGRRAGTSAAIPLAAVDHLAVRRFSSGKTTLLVLGIPAGIFGVALIGCATSNCGY
jgi:hypothetical protein